MLGLDYACEFTPIRDDMKKDMRRKGMEQMN